MNRGKTMVVQREGKRRANGVSHGDRYKNDFDC
jgi:hypothetical protein